jgi:hypothetical protein
MDVIVARAEISANELYASHLVNVKMQDTFYYLLDRLIVHLR